MTPSRRAFALSLLAPASRSLLAKPSKVLLGAQTTSFQASLDALPELIRQAGLTRAELYQRQIEPQNLKDREALRQWRLSVSMDHFKAVRRSFADAGVDIHSYYFNLRDDTSDAEIARSFDMARALGARMIVSSSLISTVARIDPFAKRNEFPVALHNHSYVRPGELARPQDFAAALRGASPLIGVCLDVGHMTAANCDPLAFLKTNADKVIALHLKDRRKNEGPDVPFGEGDTPLRETLLWAASRPIPIPSMIEWESAGGDRLAQVRQCVEFCRKTLEVKNA